MSKVKELIKNMFKRAWGLVTAGATTWDQIAAEKASIKTIRNKYIYPWISLCILLAFIFSALYADKNPFETGILNMIITAISLFGGYFISNLICFSYLKSKKPELASKTDCETIVAYSFTIIILIDIITILSPSLSFLRILSIFTAYVLWEACRAIWFLNEDDRGNIVLVFSLVLIFIPIIINYTIHLLLPNA